MQYCDEYSKKAIKLNYSLKVSDSYLLNFKE